MALEDVPTYLQPDREVHVIVSVLSGCHQAQTFYDQNLKSLLDRYGVAHDLHVTTSLRTIIELTETVFAVKALQGVKQTVVLLSGDGGVVDVVDTFMGCLDRQKRAGLETSQLSRPVIALIPMGTANALAWSTKIGSDSLGVLIAGIPKPLPLFQVKFSQGAKLLVNEGRDREALDGQKGGEGLMYGAVVFSWGLHASLVALSDTTEYRKHGLDRFKMAAQQLLTDPHTYRGKIKWRREGASWMDLSGTEHSYILATLVSNLEETFQISPSGRPVDGRLRLVAIGDETPSEIMRILSLAYQQGRHVAESTVTYEEINHLRIDFDESDERWRLLCVDGKIIAAAEGGWVEVSRLASDGPGNWDVIDLLC